MLSRSNSIIRPRAATRKTLYDYVNRCGAVTIRRDSLPQFARDLNVLTKDLEAQIGRMITLGQAKADGAALHFCRPDSGESHNHRYLEIGSNVPASKTNGRCL